MLIDIVAFILLLLAIYKGWTKGFIVAVFSFIAFIVGLAAALKLSAVVAAYIGENVSVSQRWLPVIAFLLVFVIVILAIRLGAKMLEAAVNIVTLGWLNKLAGIVFYILIYLFVYSIILFYASQLHIIKEETMAASASYSYIQPIGPKFIHVLGTVIPFFGDMFNELLHFFDNVSFQKDAAQYSFLY
ncbi:MAG TPA: CvpA family protein [Flavisolibacter sp.]|nr:CvpA family protein [Flavisolibacter sp.]